MTDREKTPRRGWGALLAAALLGSLLTTALLSGAGYLLLRHLLGHRVPLGHRRLAVSIPGRLPLRVRVRTPVHARLDTRIPVTVPIDQVFRIPLNQSIRARVHFDHEVPVHAVFSYSGTIPFHQSIHVDTTVRTHVLGIPLQVPVKGTIPVDTQVPVHLRVPIDQDVRIRFTGPLRAHVKQVMKIPVETGVHTTVPVHASLEARLTAPLAVQARILGPALVIPRVLNPDLPTAGSGKPAAGGSR